VDGAERNEDEDEDVGHLHASEEELVDEGGRRQLEPEEVKAQQNVHQVQELHKVLPLDCVDFGKL